MWDLMWPWHSTLYGWDARERFLFTLKHRAAQISILLKCLPDNPLISQLLHGAFRNILEFYHSGVYFSHNKKACVRHTWPSKPVIDKHKLWCANNLSYSRPPRGCNYLEKCVITYLKAYQTLELELDTRRWSPLRQFYFDGFHIQSFTGLYTVAATVLLKFSAWNNLLFHKMSFPYENYVSE